MKQKKKEFLKKWYTVIWPFLYVISLIPILILEKFNFPCADDLGYSIYTRIAWVDTHSLGAVLMAACRKVAEIWQDWQGTYSSVFLMALQPGIFGDGCYWVTTWLLLGAISLSGYFLFGVIFHRCLGSERSLAAAAASVYLLIGVQCMVDKTQGLFWYNGAVHYILPQAALFLLTGVILKLEKENAHQHRRLIAGILLIAYIGGGNLVTGLECGIWLMTAIALSAFGRKDTPDAETKKGFLKKMCLFLAVWAVSFGINVIAPGNWNRQEEFANRPGVIRSILQSFYYCLDFVFTQWHDWTILIFILLMLPFVVKAVQNYRGNFRFPYPLLVPVYSYCLLSSMFTPSVYASGEPGAGRIYNIIYLTHLLFIAINLVYFYGWYWKKYGEKRIDEKDECMYQMAAFFGAAFCFLIAAGVNMDSFTSTSALSSMVRGEAQEYKRQQEERLEILQNDAILDAELKDFTVKPYLLFYEDIEPDAENWKNTRMRDYYRKDTVRRIED